MNRSIVLLVAILVSVASQPGMAGTITYSWEGVLLSPVEEPGDPWELGEFPKPFTITAFVDEDAVDFDTRVEKAAFHLSDAVIVIDGVSTTAFTSGRIFFRDRPNMISISVDEVQFNGVRDGFGTATALPASAFTLKTTIESPPVFSPTTTTGEVASGRSYHTNVFGGVTVTATLIPEPSTLVLALLALMSAGITVRRIRRETWGGNAGSGRGNVGRVAPGDCSPGAPTDPDVQDYRIRFLR